jgi:hypothetical protein
MALSYDQISAITEKAFVKKLADNIFDSNPLTARLKKKSLELMDGGTSIIQPLNYALTTAAGWYSGAETLSTTDNEVITAAEYSWKQFYANISVSRIDELKNSGDKAILNFVKEKVKIAEKTMVDSLGTGVYSDGTDSKSIVGLRDIVAADQTVGGISQSTYSWWAAQVDPSTTTLTMSALQSLFNLCSIGSDMPTVGATTRAIYNLYYALLQPQQRFMDSETAKGGFQNVMFNGIPIIADSKCPSSHLFLLNENYLHLYVHKDENMRFEPFQKPINQNVKVAKIYWAGAFGSSNNRLQGKLSAIAA